MGRVDGIEVSGDRVTATVRGTLPYVVELRAGGVEPDWSCSCPAAEDGAFCKHCVAVALSVGGDDQPAFAEADGDDVEPQLESYIASLGHERLVGLVLEQAAGDWRLHERLVAEAAAAAGVQIDEKEWRRRLSAAFSTRGFVGYREAGHWARGVHDVLDGLSDLLDAGHAPVVVDLCERAHKLAEKAINGLDDSDGWLTGISQTIADLHRRACRQVRPDPVQFARRLVKLELAAELDTFHRAAVAYADVLGPDGLREYRRLVEPQWEALAPDSAEWSTERFRLREAMIGAALASGDPDEIIRVRSRDLRTPDDYAEIVGSLRSTGRADEAIEWARRGLDEFAGRTWQTPPLRELIADLLRDQGDHDAAIDLFWTEYRRLPSLTAYRQLIENAGDETAPQWRARAIAGLRDRLDATWAPVLIEILLAEGEVDDAWQVAASHGCSQHLWLVLARARETHQPLEAIPIYEREARDQINLKKRQSYRAAVKYLARIDQLATAAGRPDMFDSLLADLRTEHKAKRTLIALLDAQGW